MSKAKLSNVVLFRNLSGAQLERIARACGEQQLGSGVTIIEEASTEGSSLYVILEGSVKVHKQDFYGGKEVITTLHAGDHFGEVSLFDEAPRSAAVTTIKPCRLMVLSRQDLRAIMATDADLAARIYEALISELCQRLRDTNDHLIYLMGKSSDGG